MRNWTKFAAGVLAACMICSAFPGMMTEARAEEAILMVGTPEISPNDPGKQDNKMSFGPAGETSITTQGEAGAVQAPILGGAKLTMLPSQRREQNLSAIIETSQGKLIVVDGGFQADANYLLSQIQAKGGHVAAWLITHPHGDHAGALHDIIQMQDRNITIDGIYYSFADLEWYQNNDPQEFTMISALNGAFQSLPAEILHGDIGKGYELWVDDVHIQVMNNRYNVMNNSGNNASMVYKITVNGKKILFLGDLGKEGGEYLLNDNSPDELKADLVQMAHHGQRGVDEAVYKVINPSVCLWPTPQWLWDNDNGGGPGSGNWLTATTKKWMKSMGVKIHYATKDGDQVIQ